MGTRTYTPFAFQPETSSFQLLAFLHGRGLGSAWAQQLAAGDALRLVGPQASLPLATMTPPVALFGDETSLAVARSLLDTHGPRAMVSLEVADLHDAREAAARIGLPENTLTLRTAGDDCRGLAQRLASFAGATGTIVLTGSAQSIQHVRAELRKGERAGAQKTKGYWSEGKTGLD